MGRSRTPPEPFSSVAAGGPSLAQQRNYAHTTVGLGPVLLHRFSPTVTRSPTTSASRFGMQAIASNSESAPLPADHGWHNPSRRYAVRAVFPSWPGLAAFHSSISLLRTGFPSSGSCGAISSCVRCSSLALGIPPRRQNSSNTILREYVSCR